MERSTCQWDPHGLSVYPPSSTDNQYTDNQCTGDKYATWQCIYICDNIITVTNKKNCDNIITMDEQ